MQKHIIYIILGIAALLRFYNLNHGLPEIYEEATPMRQALEMWRDSDGGFDFNPHFFNYPAFYFYLHFVIQFIYFFCNLLIGRIHTIQDMIQLYENDPTEIVLLARFINVCFGLGGVWATYRLGQTLHNVPTGLFASAILALAPIPVQSSRIILVDTPLLFFGTLSLSASIRLFHANTYKQNIWAGVCIGLAGASKYTGALFLIPFLTAHICLNKNAKNLWHHKKLIATGFITSAIIFLFTNPYIIIDFQAFWADFTFERTHMASGHFGIDPTQTVEIYLQNLWKNVGLSLTPFLFWGFIYFFKHPKSNLHTIPIVIFVGVYITLISSWSMHAGHYLLPIIPPLTTIAAIGFHNCFQHIKEYAKLTPVIAVLIIAPISYQTVLIHIDNAKTDTRVEAKKWIIENIPQGSLIAFEYYTPDLPAERYHLLRLPMDTVQPEIVTPFYDIHWYPDFDYMIISDGIAVRYQSNPQEFAPQIQFYDDLKKSWQKIASFSGENFSGPSIHIFKRTHQHEPDLPYPEQQYEKLVGQNKQVCRDLLYRLGEIFIQKKWYYKALDVNIRLLSSNPQNPDVLAKMGFVFYQIGETEKASQAWKQALQFDPQNISILTNLGALHHKQGNPQQAIQYWQKGLELSPADNDLINNLVFVYRQLGQDEPAIQILQNALKHHPQDPAYQATLKDLQE